MEQKMIARSFKKVMAVALCVLVLDYSSGAAFGFQSQNTDSTAGGNPTDAAPSTADQLQALVAPIALYPDALVAQVLTGATFPDQIAIADYWLGQNKSLTGNALMQAVDKQSWDPSVKALTQFPSVLADMAQNLSWTSALGEAYHNQQADVMTAIQTLRAQAKAKGNLKTTSQVTVVQQSPQVIVIQPTNPQIVYVPVYNPAVIYGTPYVVPGYSTADVVTAAVIGFGVGIAVGAMMSSSCCAWGYSSWACGWHGTAVVYHGGVYYGNSAWHGGYYNDAYHGSYGYDNAYNHSNYYNNSYNHSNNYNSYNHSNSYNSYKGGGNTYNYNNVNVNKQNAQNYNSDHSSASNSWAHDNGGGSSAFSGMSNHSGGFGGSGGGGWSSRADSSRGWGSMRSSGFGGGGGFGRR
jgi:hypothetical protein